MEFKDYYKILGIERTADQKAVSQAFRKLARRYHPDVNPGNPDAERRFKEINEAYQALNDSEKRAKYDQLLDLRERGGGWEDLLRRGGAQGAQGPGGTYTIYGNPEDLGQFSEFFQQLFGGLGGGAFGGGFSPGGQPGGIEDLFRQRTARQGRRRGPVPQDVEGTVEISMEEAYGGAVRTVTIPADGGTSRTIDVTIPRGVRSGQRIRAAGQANGGDLYLAVEVRSHPVFTRRGDDVLCDAAVPVWVAALGGETEVPTLGGPVTMTIPPDTRDGQTLRLRGRGMPHVRDGGAGDELVRVRLALPHPITPRDRELLEEMRRLHEARTATS